jgi:hypothetical protein
MILGQANAWRIDMFTAILFAATFAQAPVPCDPRGDAIKAIRQLGGTFDERNGWTAVSFRNIRISDDDLKLLKSLPDLSSLELSYTPVTNAGLAHLKGLTNLVSLELYNTTIDDDGLEHLKGMKKLNFVLMKQTNVTLDGAKKLKLALPNCETISHSPRTPAIAMPVGKWSVTFANGVTQTCEIGGGGTASVVEPLRNSNGKTLIQGGTAKLIFQDDRVERWTPVGNRFVVEHWAASTGFPTATPVLGIAEKAP